ncbi:MAG: WcbI family polysaccharide biosynthesis putative acetyltransferase [Mobilicoccus sp.]|nr:WcbI family polysaccharide biosynthesis putative acetyltransferase [Mobilicoccus sp.]
MTATLIDDESTVRGTPARGRPLWVVHGGAQADPIRRLLHSTPDAPYIVTSTVSVDRMTEAHVRQTHRLLSQADVFITERLPAGYRGLPVGFDDVTPHLRPGIPVITYPRLEYGGLHPFQICADAANGIDTPPLVPYHDLRSVAVASGHRTHEEAWHAHPSVKVIREFAAWSLMRMRLTESRTDVCVADAVRGAGLAAVNTVDRPGNSLLVETAKGIQRTLGLEQSAVDPGAILLGQCRSPVEGPIAAALGIGPSRHQTWSMYGRRFSAHEIDAAQVRWYREHPRVLRTLLAGHAQRMDLLGVL